jgi:hypothetical protein
MTCPKCHLQLSIRQLLSGTGKSYAWVTCQACGTDARPTTSSFLALFGVALLTAAAIRVALGILGAPSADALSWPTWPIFVFAWAPLLIRLRPSEQQISIRSTL